jgi:hypothetical protein
MAAGSRAERAEAIAARAIAANLRVRELEVESERRPGA